MATTDDIEKNVEEFPTIEVRVYQHGQLLRRELVESEEAAAIVLDIWSELEGVHCEVDDLTVRHIEGQVLEPEPALPPEDDLNTSA